jgi:hypothetical protein
VFRNKFSDARELTGLLVYSVVGINFGRSYSCIAVINKEGRAEVIANEDGERQIPNAIAFNEEQEVCLFRLFYRLSQLRSRHAVHWGTGATTTRAKQSKCDSWVASTTGTIVRRFYCSSFRLQLRNHAQLL